MSGWWNQRSQSTRLLVYAVATILAFVMAASVGAVATLVVSGNLSWPPGERARPEEPNPAGEQGKPPQRQQANTDRPQQEHQQEHTDRSQQDKQIPYVDAVGEIQADSVEAFLDSHEKLLRYDSLKSDDIEKMQANQAALQEFTDRAIDLSAPQKFRDHKDTFLSAIDELHQAAQQAYALAADPISATQADFDDYDRLVKEAAADLQRSNEILGKNYKAIEGVQEVSIS
jgi:uncharacterized protein YhaN